MQCRFCSIQHTSRRTSTCTYTDGSHAVTAPARPVLCRLQARHAAIGAPCQVSRQADREKVTTRVGACPAHDTFNTTCLVNNKSCQQSSSRQCLQQAAQAVRLDQLLWRDVQQLYAGARLAQLTLDSRCFCCILLRAQEAGRHTATRTEAQAADLQQQWWCGGGAVVVGCTDLWCGVLRCGFEV